MNTPHILYVSLTISLLVYSNAPEMDAKNCGKILDNAFNPNYFENNNCIDGSLKKIIPEITLLYNCLINHNAETSQTPKTRNLAGAEFQYLIFDTLETAITDFCSKKPNGVYSDFADEFFEEVMKIIAPSTEKIFN